MNTTFIFVDNLTEVFWVNTKYFNFAKRIEEAIGFEIVFFFLLCTHFRLERAFGRSRHALHTDSELYPVGT